METEKVAKSSNDVLKSLLAVEDGVEATLPMKRFGVDFRIRALDGDVIDQIQNRCTTWSGKGSNRQKQIDEQKFGALIIVKACIEPNWNAKELLNKYQTHDASEVVKKRLLAGEIARLSTKILEISGFDEDEEDIKN